MNAQNAKDYLPLVQALADGKTIQQLEGAYWIDLQSPAFCDPPDHYRIKPEPRRWWINVYTNGLSMPAHPTKHEADINSMSSRSECVEVVEVAK